MKRAWKKMFMLFILLSVTNPVLPDEGMWLPHQMKDLDLQQLGLLMNPNDLYKKDGTGLMSAVVSLGGGTGEFVSNEGLLLTNHHVAFGALQRASDPENDYISDGFIAWTKEEEIPAQGYIADVLLGYKDVTRKVLSVLKDDMSVRERYDALDRIQKELIAEAEKEGMDLRCRVTGMYSGNQYILFTFKRLQDIRIVYAPPRDLGNFGGDIDNWMWPRHSCDFSFFRAYVSPENLGVEYSPENVPYHPKSFIRIAFEGVREGDFTFVMGYPGRTYRNYTLSELRFDMNRMQRNLVDFKKILEFIEKASEGNKAIEIKYASLVKGFNNALKNYQGKLEGMQKFGILKRKQETESAFLKWISGNASRKNKYGEVISKVDDFMERYGQYYWKDRYLNNLLSSRSGSAVLSQAYTVVRAVNEFQKPDMERESAYQDRNLDRLKQRIMLSERRYDFETDKAFLKYRMKQLGELPADEIPAVIQSHIPEFSEGKINDFVDHLYSSTKVADSDYCITLLHKTPEELKALEDPMILLAIDFENEAKQLRQAGEVIGQERLDLKKNVLVACLKFTEGGIAPDANGTIRFTYGNVEGYRPRDAVVYHPLTTLSGVMEKETGEYPFHVPSKLKDLYYEKDFGSYIAEDLQDVPACFLNTTNVTGGNSGSPTLNANGEQVGIIFDMTYESVIGDYYIIPELQRTISVDIRYVLFVTAKFSGAVHLIKEMGLQP